MIRGDQHASKLIKFPAIHKVPLGSQVDCGEVCVFLCLWCPRLGTHSLMPSVTGAVQSSGRQCGNARPLVVQPQLPLVAVGSTSCGRSSHLSGTLGYTMVHLIFSESHTLLFWEHFPKPQVLYCEQHSMQRLL